MLRNLRRAENHRKRRRERARRRAAFLANPFKLTKQLLGQKRVGRLTCSRDDINDPPIALTVTPGEISHWEGTPASDHSLASASSEGPLLRSPASAHRASGLSAFAWHPQHQAERRYLRSVESKIFFSLVSKRLSTFFLSNNSIDTSVQKGGITGIPGAHGSGDTAHQGSERGQRLEGLFWQTDIGLAPAGSGYYHRVYHLSDPVCTGNGYAVKSVEGPLRKSGLRQPPIRVFMDDLSVTTTSVPGARWVLQGLEKLVAWARMSFKPTKSQSLVLKRGKVIDKYRFRVGEDQIPSVTEPVKSLGKVFNCSQKDRLHQGYQCRHGGLVENRGQVCAPRKIQGLDLPARDPPKIPMASAYLMSFI
ncbi:Serine protease HtrA-like [Dissostichus eleginoides]|uniref:Serine protease HtrA-like n=1 Tax=Dissostichus eleginoides TaxID=100907 RepID=A0AAD9B9V5_DISEL|nr:Serine protease HtrA-like [Dissostichus eleginoides]